MEKREVPYVRTVFVCTHAREGKPACANPDRGADRGDLLCSSLKEEIKKAGLKKKVRVARSGCLDLCAQGPNLMIYPEGEWLSGVKAADIPDIVKKIARA